MPTDVEQWTDIEHGRFYLRSRKRGEKNRDLIARLNHELKGKALKAKVKEILPLVELAEEEVIALIPVKKLAKKLAKGSLTARSFKAVYGHTAVAVLKSLDAIVEAKRKSQEETDDEQLRYEAGAITLPTIVVFNNSRDAKYSVPVCEVISAAFSDFEELGNECREIVDNTNGTALENTNRIQTMDSTASTLEGFSEPSIPEICEKITVVILPSTSRRTGRSHRCSEICDDLTVAMEAIQKEVDDFDVDVGTLSLEQGERDELAEIADELDRAIQEAQGCEFPGMYS